MWIEKVWCFVKADMPLWDRCYDVKMFEEGGTVQNMSIAPFIRSPFTDMTGPMVNHQIKGPCAKIELRAMECLEAYGIDRGLKHPRCVPLIEDYKECETQMKQRMRVQAMRLERHRQYLLGESKEHYATGPRPDAL